MPLYRVSSGDYTSVAAARTVLQLITGSTRRAKIKEIGVFGASVTSTDAPVLIECGTETSAGTSSSFTPIALNGSETAAISTALNTFSSTEPTGFAASGPGPFRFTPIGGSQIYQLPYGEEWVIPVSTRACIRLTPPASLSTALSAYIIFEE